MYIYIYAHYICIGIECANTFRIHLDRERACITHIVCEAGQGG